MEKQNCNIHNVAETLNQIPPLSFEDEDIEIVVRDNDCVMKGITDEEMEKRNIPRNIDDIVCYIELDGTIGKLKFHQKVVDSKFELHPAPVNAIAPNQASEPKELGERLRFVQNQIDRVYDSIWDFASVSAVSIASGGHLTDYEFEYEFTT